MFHTKETRNPENLPDPGVIPILASRILVLQAPRSSIFDVESPIAKSTKKNAEPRMPSVMPVTRLATSRNAVRNLVTSQKIILIDRISLLPQVQET